MDGLRPVDLLVALRSGEYSPHAKLMAHGAPGALEYSPLGVAAVLAGIEPERFIDVEFPWFMEEEAQRLFYIAWPWFRPPVIGYAMLELHAQNVPGFEAIIAAVDDVVAWGLSGAE